MVHDGDCGGYPLSDFPPISRFPMSLMRAAVRKQLRKRRRALEEGARREAALGLLRVAAASRVFRRSTRIAFYVPNDGELDVMPLLERAWTRRKRCFLPVLDPLPPPRLRFLPYETGDRLIANRFGIPEPERAARDRIDAAALDLILLPLVAFDEAGNRLGMGGGFYDRTLGFLLRRRHWHRPVCYGVAFEFQRIERITAAAWDVPLDGCLTEIREYRFKRRSAGR
jgi:5-formyltetrahydrofolate cyclo-ligase